MLSDCIYIQRTMNIGHRILFIDLKYLMNKTLLTGLPVSYTHLTLPTN